MLRVNCESQQKAFRPFLGWAIFESLGRIVLGPVAMVRTQNVTIKYEKPTLQRLAESDFLLRSIDRERQTITSGEANSLE